jgi:hypothetical protein
MGDAEDEAAAAGIDPDGKDLAWLDRPEPVPRPEPLRSPAGKLAHLAEGPLSDLDFSDPLSIEQLTRERDEAIEQLRLARRPGITDYRVLHHVEPQGVRTYLILVVDGKASVVRLTIVLDKGQTSDEMEAQLDEVARQWIAELRAMPPSEQRRFAELIDETSDPNMVQRQVLSERPQKPWYNCVIE